MGIVSWLKDQVQTATGEKERKELVQRIKELAKEFKDRVTKALSDLNKKIEEFNGWISKLNSVRKCEIKSNIDALNATLSRYGNCKTASDFIPEGTEVIQHFPEGDYDKIEKYIGDIDWTSEEVFWNTFLRTPIGMKFTNRVQNLSMIEKANELTILIDNTVREINIKSTKTELETKICKQYLDNVLFIADYIRKSIIPELYIVNAFLEAEQIKNNVLVKKPIRDTEFVYRISCLVGTPYEIHYQFIKNAYMFFIISCKIYDTPVLTRLLEHKITEADEKTVISEGEVLSYQAGRVSMYQSFK